MKIKAGDIVVLTGKEPTFTDIKSGVHLDNYNHWFAVIPEGKDLKGLQEALKQGIIEKI